MKFNIRHAFIVGIALNRNCADILDEIYYKNENLYHEAYLKTGLHNDCLKRIFSMKTEDRINKLSGIIEASDGKNILLLEKIIKKVNPSIVNYVKKSNKVDLDLFTRKYKVYELIEEEQFSIGISLMYLAYLYKKEFIGSSFIYFVLDKWDSYIIALQNNAYHMRDCNKVDNSPETLSFIKKGYELLKINQDKEIDKSLESLLAELIERATFESMGLDYDNLLEESKKTSIEQYEKARHKIFRDNGIPGYIGSFSRYLRVLGVESSDIFIDTKINNYDLETIFRDCYYGIQYDGVLESEDKLYIVACLFIYNLVQAYKECKDMYLNKLLEDKHKEIAELEAQIQAKKEASDIEIARYKKKNKELQDENTLLKKRLKELEKENARLVGKTDKDSETIKELSSKIKESSETIESLKEECSALLEASLTIESEISLEDKINYINQYKIGIFGGLSNIKNLSNKLSNVYFYSSQNQDISSIANLDAIFISYEFFNHAFTKKINSVLKKYDIKRGYISGTNDELIIDAIYSELTKLK